MRSPHGMRNNCAGRLCHFCDTIRDRLLPSLPCPFSACPTVQRVNQRSERAKSLAQKCSRGSILSPVFAYEHPWIALSDASLFYRLLTGCGGHSSVKRLLAPSLEIRVLEWCRIPAIKCVRRVPLRAMENFTAKSPGDVVIGAAQPHSTSQPT
ncbi:hypothetical protein LY78DRAFT_20158 [Colletotrichum sublineola]|nr:hypothetical protein LY78DRAFT_20158 [Colletotrichum sublineola]